MASQLRKHTQLIQDLRAGYLGALRLGSSAQGQSVVNQALAREISPLDIYLEVVVPAQNALGKLWERGDITVAEEHLATQITLEQMARLRSGFRPRSNFGLRAVMATLEGEPHELGSRVVADMLYLDGWEVDYLGPDTPVPDLVKFVSRREVALLGISITLRKGASVFKKLMAQLRTLKRPPVVLVGGAAFADDPDKALSLGADAFAKDAEDAVIKARELCVSEDSTESLEDFLADLGQRVNQIRIRNSLSQKELSLASGLDRAYISQVERGKQNLSIAALMKLAGALGVSVREMLQNDGTLTGDRNKQ